MSFIFTNSWKAVILIIVLVNRVSAWDNDDLEIFDVVEDVNQNFYELLSVSPDASSSEIRAAFRNLTLRLHPDKNDAPDADVQFRNLVSVNNILKDPGKREKYNEVLRNGLPNWRSAVYYYRHVRKMGLIEMSLILFVILTIGQYIVAWASYAEKRYIADQLMGTKRKKLPKRGTVVKPEVMEEVTEIPSPRLRDLLPCQIVRLLVATVIFIPYIPYYAVKFYAERKQRLLEEKEREEEERREREWEQEEYLKEKESRAMRRRRIGFIPPERTGDDEPSCLLDPVDEPEKVVIKPPPVSGGLWTDDDLSELVRLVKKYPSGTSGRWERIAETMGRNVPEVTNMAARLKENCYRLPGQDPAEGEIPGLEITKKVKTKGGRVAAAVGAAVVVSDSVWSQTQQRALENALAKYPRGGAFDRWDKIAKCVPDKTKEECMLRYKYLVELVKKQKSDENSEQKSPSDSEQQSSSDNTSPTPSETTSLTPSETTSSAPTETISPTPTERISPVSSPMELGEEGNSSLSQ